MRTVSSRVYRRVPRGELLLALAVTALVVLALLAFVALWFGVIDVPRLEGPLLAPSRWEVVPVA